LKSLDGTEYPYTGALVLSSFFFDSAPPSFESCGYNVGRRQFLSAATQNIQEYGQDDNTTGYYHLPFLRHG
jgi:hypothetical protein